MEVTKSNFNEVYERLPEIFKKASFISLDTEFTGLKIDGAPKYNYFDTLKEFYELSRERVQKFLAIQIGLCAFFYDVKTETYTHEAFNFYIFPSVNSGNFTCQFSSIHFLVQHGFDFNKLFKEGIPYMKKDEIAVELIKLKEKFNKLIEQKNSSPLDIKMNSVQSLLIDDILLKIEEFANNAAETELNLERMTPFLRLVMYNKVRLIYGSQLHVETNFDETMTIFKGLSEEQVNTRIRNKFEKAKREIIDNEGFCKVIHLLRDSKKPIVGHNLSVDLFYTIHQFLESLPENLENFRQMANFIFPKVIDTKFMATFKQFHGLFESNLNLIVNYYRKKKLLSKIKPVNSTTGYSLNEEHLHVAAYDAFLSGAIFIVMAETITKRKNFLENDESILEFVNKLSVPALYKIEYLNLAEENLHPKRNNIYRMTVPANWKSQHLINSLGQLKMSWINETSVLVCSETNKDLRRSLEKLQSKEPGVEFCTYEQNKPSPESKVSKKQRIMPDEDIGEVVRR